MQFKVTNATEHHDVPFTDWSKQSTHVVTKKPQQVVNSCMHDCLQYVTHPVWTHIFSQAAQGKMPRGCILKEHRISVKIGNNVYSQELPLDAAVRVRILQCFFLKYCNINIDEETPVAKKPDKKKSNNKNLSHRRLMRRAKLDSYIKDEVKKHQMSTKQERMMRHVIYTGFGLEHFKSKDIVLEKDGSVSGIVGMTFDKNTKTFNFHEKSIQRAMRQKKAKPKVKKVITTNVAGAIENMRAKLVPRRINTAPAIECDRTIDYENLFLATEF